MSVETEHPDVSRRTALLIILATGLGVVMDGIDLSAVSMANPVLAVELDTTLDGLQWVTNGFVVAMAATLIIAGKLGDRYGHKRLFVIGLIGFGVSSLLVGLAGNVEMMIAWRVLQGLFGAVLMPTSLAILRLVFPPDQLKRAIGVWGAMAGFATAASPLVGGLLVGTLGWRWVFFINLPLVAISLALTLRTVPQTRTERSDKPLDVVGSVLLAAWLVGLMWGIIFGPVRGWTDPAVLVAFVVAAAGFAAFLLREARTSEPLVPLGIFRSASFSGGAAVLVVTGLAAFGAIFYIALYLQQVRGYSPLTAGLLMLPVTALFMVGAPIGAQLNLRVGPRVPIVGGLALIAAGALGLSRIHLTTSIHAVWPFLVLLGLGMGMASPTATEVVVSSASKRYAGVASGLEHTAGMLGTALGTAVFGSLILLRVGDTLLARLNVAGVPPEVAGQVDDHTGAVAQGVAPIPPNTAPDLAGQIATGAHSAYLDGLRLAMLVGAVVAVLGAVVAWAFIRGTAQPQAQQQDEAAEEETPQAAPA